MYKCAQYMYMNMNNMFMYCYFASSILDHGQSMIANDTRGFFFMRAPNKSGLNKHKQHETSTKITQKSEARESLAHKFPHFSTHNKHEAAAKT